MAADLRSQSATSTAGYSRSLIAIPDDVETRRLEVPLWNIKSQWETRSPRPQSMPMDVGLVRARDVQHVTDHGLRSPEAS